MCNNNCRKATIKAYNQTSQTVLTNGAVTLLNSNITGGSCRISLDNNGIKINKAGTYLVVVNANALASAAGDLVLQLFNKGVAEPGAIARATATTTAVENMGFSTIITVDPSCCCVNNNALLTFVNTGVGATYSNIAVNIIEV